MLIDILLPLTLLLGLGYVCIRFGVLSSALLPHLSQFVIKVSLPAFLLSALASKNLAEIWQPIYIAAYALGSLLVFAITIAYFYYYLQQHLTQASVLAMGASMSNTGFIGSAILTLLLDSHAAVYLSLTLIIENLCIVAVMLVLAEGAGQQQTAKWLLYRNTLFKLLKNPVILAIILGMLLAAFEVKIPQFLLETLQRLGQTASPLALFIIGAGLVGISIQSIDRESLILVALKLIVMPIMIFSLLYLFAAPTEMLYAGTLLAILPMPVAFAIFAEHYGMRQRALAPLMLSTILGFALLAILLTIWRI
jgi:malonate transporter and related proteins